MPATTPHLLKSTTAHYTWDNSLAPLLTIASGETVTFETRDAADGHFRLDSTTADVASYEFRGHPLTGPLRIEGARPGDTLQVDVLEVSPATYGWTAILPGYGLLPEDFPEPYLRTWDLADGRYARLGNVARIPLEPFCGVMGLALAEPGEHPTMPPRRTGGNMDIRQLVAGSTLYLPIEVDGALFSVGDAHAAQGDGEVCVSAIEMSATVTLRFQVRSDLSVPEPQFRAAGSRFRGSSGPAYVTTAQGPDLMSSSKQAVRYMLEHLRHEYGLSREDAYCLASVAVDLKISEIVDAPNWIVSAFLPLEVVTGT
ncbi:MAG TPA: acetamidase/formamidase family protein [Chloroflexota bacterium]